MRRVSHKDYTDEYYQLHLKYTETGSNVVKSRFDFSENATKIAKRRISRLNVCENSEII